MRSFYVHFKVDVTQCNLKAGDKIVPETVIGIDPVSGTYVYADCYGQITSLNPSSDHQTSRVTAMVWEMFETPDTSYEKVPSRKSHPRSKDYPNL
jgi:hypothetical protein